LFDLLRPGDVLVVRWIDRLGRNYADVTEVIREFMKRGIVIRTVINGLVFDGATKNPMQMAVRDALISFMAALSQAQAEATREAQRAGIEHAKTPRRRLPRQEAVLHAQATGSGPRHADDRDVDQHDRQDDRPLAAVDLPAQERPRMGRGRTRDVGGLAFHHRRRQRLATRQAPPVPEAYRGGEQLPLRLSFASSTQVEGGRRRPRTPAQLEGGGIVENWLRVRRAMPSGTTAINGAGNRSAGFVLAGFSSPG
jgi:Resolvase, N terminal domain